MASKHLINFEFRNVAMNMYPTSWDERAALFYNITVVLQNCKGLLNIEPGVCSQTHVVYSSDETETVDTKVEDISDVQKEQNPVSTINAEPEVGCMSVLRHISEM
jgi:hypothetical protein